MFQISSKNIQLASLERLTDFPLAGEVVLIGNPFQGINRHARHILRRAPPSDLAQVFAGRGGMIYSIEGTEWHRQKPFTVDCSLAWFLIKMTNVRWEKHFTKLNRTLGSQFLQSIRDLCTVLSPLESVNCVPTPERPTHFKILYFQIIQHGIKWDLRSKRIGLVLSLTDAINLTMLSASMSRPNKLYCLLE